MNNIKIIFLLLVVMAVALYVGFFREGKFYENKLFVPDQPSNSSVAE